MDHETKQLLAIAALIALQSHIYIRKYVWACLVTVLIAPLIYIVASMVYLNLPPAKLFWLPMIWPLLAAASLSVATVIGLPFLAWRRYARRRAGAAV